jgi:hypothetical protein
MEEENKEKRKIQKIEIKQNMATRDEGEERHIECSRKSHVL